MACKSLSVLAGLLAVAAASPCKPRPSTTVGATATPTTVSGAASTSSAAAVSATPTLPSTGTGTDLPAPDGVSLLKIAVGHGIQNYTCASNSSATKATGALAVLYDVTALFPGTPGTGLAEDIWSSLSSTVLWSQNIPLNLQDASAASPGSSQVPNALSEALYGAVVDAPFLDPADLTLPLLSVAAPFLGHHYFDVNSSPTFDLSAAGLLGSVAKAGNIAAPSTADKGILGTGAVDWLRLADNGKGISVGISEVYRVITAGGNSLTCAELGVGAASVPYTAFYWFYG